MRWQLVDDAAGRAPPTGRQAGSSWFGRLGDVAQQPPTLAAIGAAIALVAGRRAGGAP